MEDSIEHPRISTNAITAIGNIYHPIWSYLAFVWLGVGVALPFHFFIIADPYFRYKLHDSTVFNASISTLALSYENIVTLCSSSTNLITIILVTFVFVPYIYKYRVYTSFSVIIICLIICLSFTFVDVTRWRLLFFILTMILVGIQSISSAVALNCFVSLASTLPSRYIQAFVSGQALGGLFIIISSIVSILISSNESISATIYFITAILVIISNIIIYYFLEKSHLFQIYSSSIREINNRYEALFHESLSTSSNHNDNQFSSLTSLEIRPRLLIAYKYTKWNFYGIFLTFVSTLSLFPAYLSKIQPSYPSMNYPNKLWNDRLYAQVMTFLLFYIGDTFGRVISLKVRIPSLLYPRVLFFICLSRFLFIILFGFCHFPNRNGFPYLFQNDFIYALLILIFSLSHGYCNSINMIYAPRRVHEQLSSTVGALMIMALTSGTFVGSLLSYGIVAMYGNNKPPSTLHIQ
ncbi:unnamed protein product [Rotaria magnacalcarata]|uniref:Equilibrative nucleoside transporter 1 n=1 Tax=Rotaria magnacalcarata TaxID=392030 RepID=A0A816NKY9_9BILA|nr:unnamed protein product [Rotaria magnacalcarata]